MSRKQDFINKNVEGIKSWVKEISKGTGIDYVGKYNSFLKKHVGNTDIVIDEHRTAKANATVSSQGLFSFLQGLAKPQDEDSIATKVFSTAMSRSNGDTTVNLASLQNSGEATVRGVTSQQDSMAEDAKSEGKLLTAESHGVYNVGFTITLTRDDMLQLDAFESTGVVGFNILQEKVEYAKKSIYKKLDQVVFNGVNANGDNGIPGLLGRYGANLDFPTVASGGTWGGRTGNQIVENDLRSAIALLVASGTFKPNTFIVGQEALTTLAFNLVGTNAQRPDGNAVLSIIKGLIKDAYNTELMVHGSNIVGNNNLYIFDNSPLNFKLSIVENMVMLPAQTDHEGTLKQKVILKTAGLFPLIKGCTVELTGIN